jgi:hypothetical protein
MNRDRARPSTLSISLLLGLVTAAAYAPLWRLGFVNMDDPLYVSGNPQVLAGLGWPGFVWALTTTSQVNWHPLTWLSLMLDATIGGADPRIYHATNLLLHLASTLLLFAVLARMTGCRLKSAFVAALFAVHPLHVESVAWIAERKDVLSGVFWMLTLTAFARYAERPSRAAYAAVVAAFALGLAAKPMLVSLPIVLLLLDFWPLARWGRIDPRRLLIEKLPLFGLALASSVVTLVVQRPAMERMEGVPFGARVENALVSYVAYIQDMFWPRGLAIFYPYPHGMVWQPIAAAVVLAALSVVAIRAARRYPWLTVGWLWYVVTLVPVIGLVQVGIQARADRYTYLPLIGLFIIVAWGVPELLLREDAPDAARVTMKVAAIAVVLILAVLTWVQVGVWRNGVELFTHAIAVTGDNVLAQFNLSDALSAQGDEDGALLHLREAVRIDPHFPDAHFNLASALIRQRKVEEAAVLCRQAAEYWPDDERTLVNLGIVELLQGNYPEAEARLAEALRRYPDSAVARHNLAVARARLARSDPR